ncbi:PilC/PilY family type IV pilus protein [Archangium lansingense]|uniref:PilC/PilY family type IV pilus protein n=1 Tax=Archangium lansingense TaxID=2995310 RepID=A0ABT4A6C2_9BACT|nr:PilC/PilY family type IV pilus protein [Archangium lansinium]MCY1077206.1 PilC/PilY family type IV pilus protein [Archangium lansinium]
MKALRIRPLVVLCLMTLPFVAGATEIRFEQGSLIIPMQRAYQTQCGAVAAYGLIYRLLQQKVTIYWAVEATKSSHHRCKNLSDDAKYLDGCDMIVAKEGGRPVSLLKNSSGTFVDDFDTFDTQSNPNSTGEKAFKVDDKVNRLRYMGGPFIIEAAEANKAMELLRTHADFAKFRGAEGGMDCTPGSAFNVRVHRANNAFLAPIARLMNEVPPPIALVKGSGSAVTILEGYLKNAGLDFPGAAGTFESHGKIYDVLDQDTDLVSSPTHPKSKLNFAPNPTAPTKTYYKVMWAPHWEGTHGTKLQSALSNIAHFTNLGNSSFNECASLQTYEDGYLPGDTGRPGYLYVGNGPTQFMSKTEPEKEDETAQAIEDAKEGPGLQTLAGNELVTFASNGQDCSDPGLSSTADCYIFSNHGDLFSQKGDYTFAITVGLVEGFRPRKGKDYGAGTLRMISTRSTKTPAKNGWDIYISRQKNNNRLKGNVLYLGGHSFVSVGAGNRMALNTLLNLAYKPAALETSRSEPVADVTYKADGNVDKVRVLSGTYMETPPPAHFPERLTFQPGDDVVADKSADWIFPYIEGRFRSILAEDITKDRKSFADVDAEWEATTKMPKPGDRKLFTVLGTNQEGLVRVPFTLDELKGSCQDDDATGKIKGVCDLQEAFNLDRDSAGISKLDKDEDGKIDPAATTLAPKFNHTSQHFLQRVRGFCVAHSKSEDMTPNDSKCDNRQFGEVRSTLGGLDHASAAVVGASDYVKGPRPEVAYIGGLDGQLHAIYLRGSKTGFSAPAPGTELWAFIPKGQLSRLRTNNARVDISPVVSDVYVDYEDRNGDGVLSPTERDTGIFRWRTVLVSGSGRLGGELFALDVTDPTDPIVLWDLTATQDKSDAPQADKNTAFMWSDPGGTSSPNYAELTSAQGVAGSGPYNYKDFGDSLALNLVPVRRGNRPVFQVVVATNGATEGARRLQVFSLDAGTGRKFWQWERPYGATASNSVPGGTSTVDLDNDGAMDRVYVGDMEGKLWELNIHTGANINSFKNGSPKPGSYPLFSTADVADMVSNPHPISTVPAIMRLPYDLDKNSVFPGVDISKAIAGKLAIVFGTAGPDWVLPANPDIKGRVYVVASTPEDLTIRHHLSYDQVNEVDGTTSSQMTDFGTAKKEASAFMSLEKNERAVGSPKIVGGKIVLTTAYGTTENDPFKSDMQGRTHVINVGQPSQNVVIPGSGKSAAGGLVLPDGAIVTQSMVGLQRIGKDEGLKDTPKAGLAGKRTPARIGSWLDLGRALAE